MTESERENYIMDMAQGVLTEEGYAFAVRDCEGNGEPIARRAMVGGLEPRLDLFDAAGRLIGFIYNFTSHELEL